MVCIFSVMTMFKKYLADKEGKDSVNPLHLYMDIDTYNNTVDNTPAKYKKRTQANFIQK